MTEFKSITEDSRHFYTAYVSTSVLIFYLVG